MEIGWRFASDVLKLLFVKVGPCEPGPFGRQRLAASTKAAPNMIHYLILKSNTNSNGNFRIHMRPTGALGQSDGPIMV